MSESDYIAPISELVEQYFAMWNETDESRRRAVIEATWVHDATYVDPLFAAEGHEGLDALVAGVHRQYPGARFTLTGIVDAHHDRARWGWQLAGSEGDAPIATGIDVAVRAPDGRLSEVIGFFRQPAEAA